MTPTPTSRRKPVTNADIMDYIQDEVITRIAGIEKRSDASNGAMVVMTSRLGAHDILIKDLSEATKQNCLDIAVLQERSVENRGVLANTRDDQKELAARVWNIALRVAEIGGIVLILTKVSGVW